MRYKEEYRDLFSVPEDYYLAHCISADFGMGKGIAVEFNYRFDMKNKLKSKYPNFLSDYQKYHYGGMALIEDRVINLITKCRRKVPHFSHGNIRRRQEQVSKTTIV